MMSNTTVIILAAGKGSRMKSQLPKVMHQLAGRPLLHHVLALAEDLDTNRKIVVISPKMEKVANAAKNLWSSMEFAIQPEPRGTGHALQVANNFIGDFNGEVLILYGDVPLLRSQTILELQALKKKENAAFAILSFTPLDPSGYGRIITDSHGFVSKVVEDIEANSKEKNIAICNSGIIVADGQVMQCLLKMLNTKNSKNEYFVTDVISLANDRGFKCVHLEVEDGSEVMGINDKGQLALAEDEMQTRLRAKALASGVSMIDPSTVWLSWDTHFGNDVEIEPNVFFGPNVIIGNGTKVRAFCHLEGVEIGDNATIGPFARLRPGTNISNNVRVGNFVETKNANIGNSVKINHLSYIGDTVIGEESNIGAGTITCNYDGYRKSQTTIESNVFIGSNSSLVAPVKIGQGSVIGAGSVITKDVEADSIAVARSKQQEQIGAAARRKKKLKGRVNK